MDTTLNQSTPPFDAEEWFSKNIRGATKLKADAKRIVTYFTILWNIFEGIICDTNASVDKIKKVIKNMTIESEFDESIDKSLSYYRDRYLDNGETNQLFEGLFNGLKIKNTNYKELIKKVLKSERVNINDKLLALLIVVYRIRNHLFHGTKSVDKWNDQGENISQANFVLSIVLEAKRCYLLNGM